MHNENEQNLQIQQKNVAPIINDKTTKVFKRWVMRAVLGAYLVLQHSMYCSSGRIPWTLEPFQGNVCRGRGF